MFIRIITHRSTTWCFAVLLAGLLETFTLANAAEHSVAEYCSHSPNRFASCPKFSPSYRAVILVVHGWNGSCKETFGEGKESIFQVLQNNGKNFYDFDCFQYDSTNTAIPDNIEKLHERIQKLHELGYTHAMLITHSTGGVMALQVLTNAVLRDEGAVRHDLKEEVLLASNGIQVTAVQAWATPINGLKFSTKIGAKLVALLGYNRENILDLDPDSDFLTNLKKRLKILGDMPDGISREARMRAENITVNFYHGQGKDLIVREIDPNEARKDGWLWSAAGRGELINTGTGHSHNVAESGEVGAPRFTGRVMDLEAHLTLPFEPRLDKIFPDDLEVVPSSLEDKQIGIIDTMIYYARSKFSDAIPAITSFLNERIGRSSEGARSKKVDKHTIERLLDFLNFQHASKDLVHFLINLHTKVITNYNPADGTENLRSFGYNEGDVVNAMRDLVIDIIDKVSIHFENLSKKQQNVLLRTYGYDSLPNFLVSMHNVVERFLRSDNHIVQNQTIADIRDVVKGSTEDVLSASSLLESLRTFSKENYPTLAQEQKTQILQTIESAVSKSPTLRADTLKKWSIKVPHLGKQRPLWATLNDDDVVARIVAQIPYDQILQLSEWNFLADVASRGGARGNNLNLALIAEQQLQKAISKNHFDPTLRSQYIYTLTSAGKIAVYPSISRKLLHSAQAISASR